MLFSEHSLAVKTKLSTLIMVLKAIKGHSMLILEVVEVRVISLVK